MRALDNDALICDFAQYYHIYDFTALDLKYAAVLACGLPKESRIMTVMSGKKFQADTLIQLAILDTVRALEHAFIQAHSKDELPEFRSLLTELFGEDAQEDIDAQWFTSADDFKAEWARVTGKVTDDG